MMEEPAKIFLCSTKVDLQDERSLVLEAIRRLHLLHNSMEYFGARDNPPIETCLNEVIESDILVIIVGHMYGSYVPEKDISYSEAEYNEGYGQHKTCFVYFKNDNVPILPKYIEQEPKKITNLKRWKETLNNRHIIKYFETPTDLALQVMADLSTQINKKGIPRHICLFDSNPENTFYSRYIDSRSSQSGNIGLFFYDLDIVNSSDKSYTIKNLILKYDFEGKTHSTISTVLQTGSVLGKNRKADAIRVKKLTQNGIVAIYLARWTNIRTIIGERKVLVPGSTLHGSALFVLETNEIEKLTYIENIKIIIEDFSGNTTEQPVEIQKKWKEMAKDTFVQSEPFKQISE